MRASIVLPFLIPTLVSCVSTKSEPAPPKRKEPIVKKDLPPAPKVEDPKIQMPPPVDTCMKLAEGEEPPFWVEKGGFMVTRLIKQCVTFGGEKGIEKNSPWMAMGVPCTGGEGKISIIGNNYIAPKLVSFHLTTDCPMKPSHLAQLSVEGQRLLGFEAGSKILAYNPLSVQYWEIPGLPDAGVGSFVELRTFSAVKKTWRRFIEGESLMVKFYGRENAWVASGGFFGFTALLTRTARYGFKLEVVEAEVLTQEAAAELKGRCEALKPRRNCDQVF